MHDSNRLRGLALATAAASLFVLAPLAAHADAGANPADGIVDSGDPTTGTLVERTRRRNEISAEIRAGAPEDFGSFINEEGPKWAEVIKSSGLKLEP